MRKAVPRISREKVAIIATFSKADIPCALFSLRSVVKSERKRIPNASISIMEAPGQCKALNKIPTVASTSASPLKIGFDFMIKIVLGFRLGNIKNMIILLRADS